MWKERKEKKTLNGRDVSSPVAKANPRGTAKLCTVSEAGAVADDG